MSRVANQKQTAPSHRLGDETAQRSDRLLDTGAGDHAVRCFCRQPAAELIPEGVVSPFFQRIIDGGLNVVARQVRISHRTQGKPTLVIGVNQFLINRRRFGQDAQPTERIHLFILTQYAVRDSFAADAVEAVTTRDPLAVNPVFGSVLYIGDVGRIGICAVDCRTVHVMDDLAIHPVSRVIEIARYLGLSINHHGFPDQPVEIDPEFATFSGEKCAVMNETLAVHALAYTRFAQQIA